MRTRENTLKYEGMQKLKMNTNTLKLKDLPLHHLHQSKSLYRQVYFIPVLAYGKHQERHILSGNCH